jgi:transmembrane sensor
MSLSSNRPAGEGAPVAETAAAWALRQEERALSSAEQREFDAWLAGDRAHLAAYDAALWALDAPARHAGEPPLMAMREAALSARGERRSSVLAWGGLGGAVAASMLGLWLWTGSPDGWEARQSVRSASQNADPRKAGYSTAVGERLTVTLPDSSVVTLDTDSRIRVAYSGLERGVQLLRGQALFDVAHGRPLPFQVYAAGQRITAVGTLFNVRLDGSRVKVALLKGVVRLRPASPAVGAPSSNRRDIVMRAGDAAELRAAQPAIVRPADVARLASWRSGELVFNDTRLGDAVAEVNRYTTHPIAIADSNVGNYRITGVFRSSDPERFSEAMSEILPVEVAHSPDGAPVLRARN